jgi:hypothetical protein
MVGDVGYLSGFVGFTWGMANVFCTGIRYAA